MKTLYVISEQVSYAQGLVRAESHNKARFEYVFVPSAGDTVFTLMSDAEDWLRDRTIYSPALTNTPLVVYRILRRIREGAFKPRDLKVFWIGEKEIQGVHPTGDGTFEAELEGGFFEAAFDEYLGSILQKGENDV